MGLLGGLLKVGGGIIGTIIGGNQNKKAISKASAAEQAAINRAIDEQRRQFDLTRQDYMPWQEAGTQALGGITDLLGLGGADEQTAAIEALRNSPLYQSLYRNGEEALLQNASATGGLRGGNMQRELADFGADTLTSVIEQQLARLGGLSGTGAQMVGSLGGLRANMANNVSQGLIGIGQSQAGSILGRQQVRNDTINKISSIIGSAIGGGFPGMGGF